MRLSLIASLFIAVTSFGAGKKITISCGSNGVERQLCVDGANAWAKKTGNTVEIFSTPNESNDRLALYQQLLGAKSKDIDLYQIDVVWPGILGAHFIDLKTLVPPTEVAEHLAETVRNNTLGDRLVALPWFTDGGLLYYRKDLLQKYGLAVPKTWDEFETAAKTVQEKEGGKVFGFVFQGRSYEGLTCNALEWLKSFNAGTIVDDSGKVTIHNPQAVEALKKIASFVGTIAPSGVLSYGEEESRGVFQSGKAVFMRNWPYAWALANSDDSPIKGKVGIARLPSGTPGGPSAATLGGWSLAVSAYSANPTESVELARYLTGYEQQKKRSIDGSFNPTLTKLYDDPDVLKKNPHLKELKSVFLAAVPRPSRLTKAKYNRVSADFWNAVHAVLSKKQTPEEALKALEARIGAYSNGGKW